MLRSVDGARAEEELRRMQRLDEALSLPQWEDRYRRALEEGWLSHHPELYHVYEVEGELRGYVGLFPIRPETYRRFVSGKQSSTAVISAGEILSAEEYARARQEGVWVWIERLVAVDIPTRQKLGEYVYHHLAQLHLKGLLVTTWEPKGETDCRWLGLVPLEPRPPQEGAVGKLWHADEAVVAPSAEQPFGPATPIRCLFLTVKERFGRPVRRLHLSPRERQVARLFFLDDRKTEEIARLMQRSPGTVKSYLQRIRQKAAPVVGSGLTRRVAAYLLQNPQEVVELEE